MTSIVSIDTTIFLFLNRGVANPVFDIVMPFLTDLNNWKIPIALLWLSLIIFGGKKGRITALLVVVILTMTDQLSSSLIKPWVGRVRPCFVLENVRLLINQPHSPSFPSSHATNNAGMAFLFSMKYRRFTWLFILIAVMVAYSRIYVGVHYPSDILAGGVLGVLCAAVILGIEKAIGIFYQKKRTNRFENQQKG